MRFVGMAFMKRRSPHRENHGHDFCLIVAWAFPLISCLYPNTAALVLHSNNHNDIYALWMPCVMGTIQYCARVSIVLPCVMLTIIACK